ncbi:unnamed protein product [Pocillopora meandrina]|uniref:O-methyltransferase C-terminal domain-containing protein n=1 Tax=Pocillopora meandrina TaxID=46732 RepID=A0AAU9W7I5_9CNID|nr:unnamed protein product [Pocillopora meandrina]
MELLRKDKGPSLGQMVGYYASDELWAAMLAFRKAVKDSGGTAFERAYGLNLYDYIYRAEEMEYFAPTRSGDMVSDMGMKQRRSEFVHNYNRAMITLSKMDLDSAQPTLFIVYPWVKSDRIMDIGGRKSQFLSQRLQRNVPDHRVTLLKGDILDGIPKGKEVDTIIAKNLFVIFTEDGMVKVLENCRQVLAAHRKFIIVNSCNPEAKDTEHNVNKTGLHLDFRGIHIMAMSMMGHFRTKSEWLNLIDRLCKKVAFRLNAVYETGDGPTLFELLNCE